MEERKFGCFATNVAITTGIVAAGIWFVTEFSNSASELDQAQAIMLPVLTPTPPQGWQLEQGQLLGKGADDRSNFDSAPDITREQIERIRRLTLALGARVVVKWNGGQETRICNGVNYQPGRVMVGDHCHPRDGAIEVGIGEGWAVKAEELSSPSDSDFAIVSYPVSDFDEKFGDVPIADAEVIKKGDKLHTVGFSIIVKPDRSVEYSEFIAEVVVIEKANAQIIVASSAEDPLLPGASGSGLYRGLLDNLNDEFGVVGILYESYLQSENPVDFLNAADFYGVDSKIYSAIGIYARIP